MVFIYHPSIKSFLADSAVPITASGTDHQISMSQHGPPVRYLTHDQHVGFQLDSFTERSEAERLRIICIGVCLRCQYSYMIKFGRCDFLIGDQAGPGLGVPASQALKQALSHGHIVYTLGVHSHANVALFFNGPQLSLLGRVCTWHGSRRLLGDFY